MGEESSSSWLSFDCSRCEEVVVAEITTLPGYDYSAEFASDGRGEETLHAECQNCRKEYLVEISNISGIYEAEVVGAANIDVFLHVYGDGDSEYDEYDYSDYIRSYVPDEPAERYRHSLKLLDEIIAAAQSLGTYPMFHRMVLLQNVAMMEAYLCDRLITLVSIDVIRANLINRYQLLRDQKYSLSALVSNPDLIHERTIGFLKSQLYHDVDEVEKIYRCALDNSPFKNEEMKRVLKAAMINRHHCVHRDGKDNDGRVIEEVNAEYVREVRQAIQILVDHVESVFKVQILEVTPKSPF